MVAQNFSRRDLAVPLRLAGGDRIVTSALEPVFGWTGTESARAAQPLTFPSSVLAPDPTTAILYGCNLPAPTMRRGEEHTAPSTIGATLLNEIGRELEGEFIAASLPGGQIKTVSSQGELNLVKFRWLCITAHVSIGAVWRCFVQTGTLAAAGLWRTIGADYIFEASAGLPVNGPGEMKVHIAPDNELKLSHPSGMLTSFPCRSGRVKITRLAADGRAGRSLSSLVMYPDRSIVAFFSDGGREIIATAAPAHALPARAA